MTDEQLHTGQILQRKIKKLEALLDMSASVFNEPVLRAFRDCTEIPLSVRLALEKRYADEARGHFQRLLQNYKDEFELL